MDVKSHTLVANARTRIHHPGRFFILIETGAQLDVTFEFRGSPVGEIGTDVQAGYKRFPGNWADPEDGRFDTIVMTSATAQTVVIGISQSAGDYTRVVSIVEQVKSTQLYVSADVTLTNAGTTTVFASLSTRFEAFVQNVSAVGYVRLGFQSFTGGNGIRLGPGQSAVIATTSMIKGQAETTDVDVSVAWTA